MHIISLANINFKLLNSANMIEGVKTKLIIISFRSFLMSKSLDIIQGINHVVNGKINLFMVSNKVGHINIV